MRYSNDFRKLAMKMIDSGKTVAQVVETMGMGIDTFYCWIKKNKEGTLYDIINNGGHPTVYDMEGLRAFVEANPDKYLREIKNEFFEANGQKGSFNGIHKALKKLDLGLKKNSILHRKR